MILFVQIFFANIFLIFILITIHEIGHWVFGRVIGIPPKEMKIRLFTFPQQVQIRDSEGWVSVSNFDRYLNRLRELVPAIRGQFMYVVGGFIFETLFLILLTILLGLLDFWLYAIVAPGVSLMMYLVYLFAMDFPQSKQLNKPWGDTTILLSLSKQWSVFVIISMIVIRIALILITIY